MFIVVTIIILPLVLYLGLFGIEVTWSVRRLFRPLSSRYFDATWEITHTLLIFAVNAFLWLYSTIVVTVAYEVAPFLLCAVVAFMLRTVFYLTEQYVKAQQKRIMEIGFAISSVVALIFVVAVVGVAVATIGNDLPQPNTHVLPYVWPGLIFSIACCALPVWRLYRTTRAGTENPETTVY